MQTTQITVDGFTLDVSVAELLRLVGARAPQIAESAVPTLLPASIGAELQGGIYVGPMFDPEASALVHLITALEYLEAAEWDAAKEAASAYRGTGFSDWHLPTKNECMTALMYAQEHFEKGWHWTSTPYESYAWAVDFQNGHVDRNNRINEFRVRPVRRFIA